MSRPVADRKSRLWMSRSRTGLSRERVAALLDPPVTSKTIERWEKGIVPIPGYRKAQLTELYARVMEAA